MIHRAICARHLFLGKDGEIKLGGFRSARLASEDRGYTVAEDIGGLGTLLYELLIAAPSEGSGHARLSHHLKTMCLRCLGKQPPSYPTAVALAEDLHRFC